MAAANPLNFNDFIQLIRNGEPLSAGVPNRPISAVDARTRYLWDVLQASFLGSTTFARQQTTAADVLVGEPVYWNANTQRFERGLAGVSFDAATGGLVTSDASQIWGIIAKKINSTLCDVLLSGFAKIDITAALQAGETLKAGTYYLSRTSAGKLVSARSPIPVQVLRATGNGYVFVSPQWPDLTKHSHLRFRLKPIPAGTHVPPESGDRHVITNPNVHVEGWLPADHAVFDGKAPAHAKFGYNISANAALLAAWPPLPPENAVLLDDGVMVPDGDQGLVIFDRNGIWWLSDCYDTVPWEATLATDYEVVSESAVVSITPEDCPYIWRDRLDLFFTKYEFLTDQTVVTSLVTNDDRISIFCAGGDPLTPSNVGPLEIKLNLEFLSDDTDPGGFLALKAWDPETGKFHRGPVTTGVFARSTNVTLTSDNSATETIDDVERTVHHGRVGIEVTTDDDREIFPDLVRLGGNGASEEYVSDVMYLQFDAGVQLRSLRVRFQIPTTLSLVNPKFALKLRVMGLGSGTLPNLVVTYRRVPAATTPAALPTSDSSYTIVTTDTLTAAKQYVDKTGNQVPIAAGDELFVTVLRNISDGYASDVGLLRISGILSAS